MNKHKSSRLCSCEATWQIKCLLQNPTPLPSWGTAFSIEVPATPMSVIRRVVVKILETRGEHLSAMLLCSISKNGIPFYKFWLFLEVTKHLFLKFQFYFTNFQIFLCHFIRYFIPTNLTILTWLTLTMAKIGYSPFVAGWFHYLRTWRWWIHSQH